MHYWASLWVLLGLCCSVCVVGESRLNCDAVRPFFEEQGFSAADIPKDPISSKQLKSCGGLSSGGEVCCSADMEQKLQAKAKEKYEKATKATLQQLHQLLAVRGQRFHNFFRDLLVASKKGFHEMFKKTYGILYEQNAHLFTDFFKELENYYTKGTVNLDDVMDNFFNTLYQKMFTVLNGQYNFDNKYLECVGNHMKEMRPFGDVPQKLGVQIKRSFVATRAFSQALTVAADILKNMQTLKTSPECAAALTRMTACPSCSGIPGNVLACVDMCSNVMKGCYVQHAALDTEWNHFVEAVGKVADRLLGPFNIEMLIRPINLKISEAIMNFQENSHDVSQRVFGGCGKPVLGKRRRRRSRRSEIRDVDMDRSDFDQYTTNEDGLATTAMLDKLVKEIRQKIKDSKQFWLYLPYQRCNEGLIVPPSNTKECWNGTHVDKYIYPVSPDGEVQILNPEVRGGNSKPLLVREQLFALTAITNRLRSAFNGQDVDWADAEETFDESGSGSGDDEKNPPDDTERGDDDGSGEKIYDDDDETSPLPPSVDDPTKSSVPPPRTEIVPKIPTIDGTLDNNNIDTTKNSTSINTSTGHRPNMTLYRALTSYLFPVVVMWFGGCFTELL